MSESKMLNKVEFENLVDIHNEKIKSLFMESFKNDKPPELIGKFFERSLAQLERKDKGQYYTPKVIVEYMISQLKIKKDSKILDPSCGCGSFLLTVFDLFKEKFGQEFLNNIFGVDVNENAVKMTRACLFMKSDYRSTYINVTKRNIRVGNSIVLKKEIDENAINWQSEFHKATQNGGFDFIIGNPPYVTLRKYQDFDPSESIYSRIINGPVNAATLMIGKSLELLKENGILAFLLPKSILYVNSYINLRKYLVKNTEILQIFDLGSKFKDVRGEQFILIVKKKKPDLQNKVKIRVFSYKNKPLSKQPSTEITQSKFLTLGKFLTFNDPVYYKLIDKLSGKGIPLKEYVNGEIFRGLPIGGNHLKKRISKGIEAIRGKNIAKFKIKNPLTMPKKLLKKQTKAKINKLQDKKVILQNIFSTESGVIAAYDDSNLISLDTVTNILVPDEEKGKYILALLNSKLINFYLIYGIFNKSRLTMHLDKSYIGLVPIIYKPRKKEFKKLVEIVDSLTDISESNKVKRKIDELVYNIYSLNKREEKLVEEAISKMLSRRSIW